jgi:ABC-type phosphate/phosphonate transport system substrate-binding protein
MRGLAVVRATVVLIVICAGLLPAHAQDEQQQLTIGVVSGQLGPLSEKSFHPFSDYLSERVPGADFRMVPLANIEALVEAVKGI